MEILAHCWESHERYVGDNVTIVLQHAQISANGYMLELDTAMTGFVTRETLKVKSEE